MWWPIHNRTRQNDENVNLPLF
uniref:Uncharacterized protein n=1 Tax=Anguilla anguilla TaxID=7936 RepID=A0A0E9TPP7_ANGAN